MEEKNNFFKLQQYLLLERSPLWILQPKITIYLAVDYRMHLQFSAILAKSPARLKGSQHLLVEGEILPTSGPGCGGLLNNCAVCTLHAVCSAQGGVGTLSFLEHHRFSSSHNSLRCI